MFNNSTDVRRFRALAFVGLSALIFLAPAWTYAQTCVDIFAEASVLDVLRESGRFLAPNEVDPHHVLPILNLAKPGTLVSVGTERGFLYAGMSPRVRALALIDMDPAVVYFNRLNVKLLRAARNRGDYLHLRLAADETEWRRRGIVDADTGAIWQWWREKVKYNADSGNASRNFFMHDKNSGYFTEVNYLYFDEQFARVKGLADRGLISIVQANLGRAEDAHLISEALTSSGIPVTVLDISNAWERQYAGPEGVGQFLKSVKDQLDPQARLILSSLSSSSMGHWQYFAYLVTDIFSTQLRPYFWEWFMSGGKDAPILKTAPSYWEQPSGRVRALLQGRDDISNLNAMLNLGGASEKILAMRLITINRKADAETIFNLLKILGEGDRDLQKSSLRILEYFAAKDAEHGAQVLKFALMNSRRISLESLTPMVSAAARTVRGHSAEFLAFFYEVFERGAADGDLIDAIGLADPLEQNRPLFKEKLVQLRARLAGLNTYYGNFISESQVAPRLIEKGP